VTVRTEEDRVTESGRRHDEADELGELAGGYPDGEERDVLAGRSFDAGVLDVLGVVQESQPVERNLGGVDLLVALEAGPPGTDDVGAPGRVAHTRAREGVNVKRPGFSAVPIRVAALG
jgi:hypothetical protein